MKTEMTYRTEKDFLGEKKIPADVYYGIQTLRAAENFPITGYKIHEEMIKALAVVKKAAALANMETNVFIKALEMPLSKPLMRSLKESCTINSSLIRFKAAQELQ